MKDLKLAEQVELLDTLLAQAAWEKLLKPMVTDAQEAAYEMAKMETDPYKVARHLGMALGLDVITQLPQLRDILAAQLKAEKEAAADKA